MNRYLKLICLSLLLSGCSLIPTGPKFKAENSPENGKALIYVWRSHGLGDGVPHIQVLVDGKKYAALSSYQYDAFYLDPGNYVFDTIPLTNDDVVIKQGIKVSSGSTYYIKQVWEKLGGGCIVIGVTSNCNFQGQHVYYVQENGDIPSELLLSRKADPIQ